MGTEATSDRITRVAVREATASWLVVVAMLVLWKDLAHADPWQVLVAFFGATAIGYVVAVLVFERRLPRPLGRRGEPPPRWEVALRLLNPLLFASLWWPFPWRGEVGPFVGDGMAFLPINVARSFVVAGALALGVWLILLIVDPTRPAALRRLREEGPQTPSRSVPGGALDLVLFAIALLTLVLPNHDAMDAITTPFTWPAAQIGAACLLLLVIVKQRAIDPALLTYRVVSIAAVVGLIRLGTSAGAALAPVERVLTGIGFLGIVIVDVAAHVTTARGREPGLSVARALLRGPTYSALHPQPGPMEEDALGA